MTGFPILPPVFDGKSRKIGFESIMLWLQQGWGFFRDNPGFWILITVFYLAITGIACMIPWIGVLIAVFFTPLLTTGLLQACKNISDGKKPDIADLFAGFTARTGQLIALGLFSVLMLASIALAIGLLVGGIMNRSFNTDSGTAVMLAIFALLFIVPILMTLLFSPVLMAVWFAPALVYFNHLSPVDALKASFIACLKNIWQFLFYGLIVSLMLFVAMLTAGIGLLILLPVISGSVYASYHDIFLAN